MSALVLGVFKFVQFSGEESVNVRNTPCPAVVTFTGSRMTNGPHFNADTMVFGFTFSGYGQEKAAIFFGNTSPEIFVCPDYRECTSSSWHRIV